MGVTRLGDTRGKKQVCAPMFKPEVFRKQMYCIEEGTCDIVGTFRRPPQSFNPPVIGAPIVIRRPGNCAPLVTPLIRAWACWRNVPAITRQTYFVVYEYIFVKFHSWRLRAITFLRRTKMSWNGLWTVTSCFCCCKQLAHFQCHLIWLTSSFANCFWEQQ